MNKTIQDAIDAVQNLKAAIRASHSVATRENLMAEIMLLELINDARKIAERLNQIRGALDQGVQSERGN